MFIGVLVLVGPVVALVLPSLAGLSGTTAHYVIFSLVWAAGLVAVFAPLAVAKFRKV